ncbi:MAG: flavodoxin domain-containing protein [Candidatus Odinarchaeota archaeon]
MNSTLIVYGTRCGASREVAELIASVLRDKFSLKVEVVNIKKMKGKNALEDYENIIVGSSIACGKWTKQAERFLKNDFSDKKVAIFVTSGGAGEALEKNDQELYQKWQKLYITDVITPYDVKPVSIKAFGGHFRFFKKAFIDNLNHNHIKEWADQLGKLLSTQSSVSS